MQLCDLTLKRARHHPLSQAFEAVHLGLHQTALVVTAPFLPNPATQPLAGSQRCIAHCCALPGFLPRLAVLARGYYRLRASLRYRRMALFGVIGTVGTHTGYRLIRWYLRKKSGQHGRVAHAVICDFNGPYLQRAGINAQVHLAPLPPVLGPVFLAFPFPFAQELDARAVHQQIQRCAAAPVRQLHLQCPLAAAEGAEVGNPPIELGQLQQALNQPQALAQCQAKQALDAQAKLNGRIREHLLATPLATGRCVPLHVFVQPDRQRPSGLERRVVLRPVGGFVAGLWLPGFTHASRLPAQRGRFVQQSRMALNTWSFSAFCTIQIAFVIKCDLCYLWGLNGFLFMV